MADYRARYYFTHPVKAWRELVYWQIKNAGQLARRGWADSDTWSLDNALCRRLGAQLLHLADVTHGWPDDEYETFDEWRVALRENGRALINYVERPGYNDLLAKWHELRFGTGMVGPKQLNAPSTPEQAAALKALEDIEQRYSDNATKALHWVADNLGHLWD